MTAFSTLALGLLKPLGFGFAEEVPWQPQSKSELKEVIDDLCVPWKDNHPQAPNLWDVSLITDFERLFEDCKDFNEPIGNWDTSGVTSMSRAFRGVSGFNQDLSRWDVGSVKDFSAMFDGASSFNSDIGNWDVSSAISFNGMFKSAVAFNQVSDQVTPQSEARNESIITNTYTHYIMTHHILNTQIHNVHINQTSLCRTSIGTSQMLLFPAVV